MRKYFLHIVLVAILAAITFNSSYGQFVKLPLQSNLYPDTFAINWSDKMIKNGIQLKGKLTISLNCTTIFGDGVFKVEPTRDTLIALLIAEEFSDSEQFLIEPYFRSDHSSVRREIGMSHDLYQLKLIPRNQKISALRGLVETNPSINNFLLLAEAFEELECFVNAYYIYFLIMLDDAQAGENHFHQFYQRNLRILNPPNQRHNNIQR